MTTTSSFSLGASQESESISRESLLVYIHPLPLVHLMTSGPGRKGRRRSRVSKLLPLVSKQTNNGGSVRPLTLSRAIDVSYENPPSAEDTCDLSGVLTTMLGITLSSGR